MPIQDVFLMGYPGDLGGANTEAWHTLKLWRRFGLRVHLIPTWNPDENWRQRLDAVGCTTHHIDRDDLERVPGLEGALVVGMCNGEFIAHAHRLRRLGCRLVWVNCMTFLFEPERRLFAEHGPADAFVFQSIFQRGQLEPQLRQLGYDVRQGFTIRGAFDVADWAFRPRPHVQGGPFVIGRVSRPDVDKWSSNTWQIYDRIQYRPKEALMLGMDERTHAKLGPPPKWARCLPPMGMDVQEFFSSLHCMLPINGGARENWPRVGLEAMAAGAPVVAERRWGWPEMIEHGLTGFLGSSDEELSHYAAVLAYNEELRIHVARAARYRLTYDLADASRIWHQWCDLFEAVSAGKPNPTADQ